ncbi:MAG TPA: EamA family transporter [Acidimicrobiia bacterium]|nr:EamA family transporter [Acidimicrobiia bacterium]
MGVLLAGVAALGYGVGDFLGGAATRRLHVVGTLFWAHLVGFVLIGAWIPFDRGRPLAPDISAGLLAGILGLGGLLFLYTGLARGRAAVVAPVAAVVGAIVPVTVGVAGGEPLGPVGWTGVAAALPAIYLASTIDGVGRRAAGLSYGLGAGLFFGGHFVAFAQATSEAGMWPVLASRGLTTVLLGVLALVMRGRWNVTPTGRVRFVLFGVGALDLIGNVGYVTAVNLAPLAVVAVVASLYPAVTVLMARFVYSEILSPAQIAGLGLAVVAVACFSVVG